MYLTFVCISYCIGFRFVSRQGLNCCCYTWVIDQDPVYIKMYILMMVTQMPAALDRNSLCADQSAFFSAWTVLKCKKNEDDPNQTGEEQLVPQLQQEGFVDASLTRFNFV